MPQSQAFDKCFFNISTDFIGLIAGGRLYFRFFVKTANRKRRSGAD